MKRTVLIDILYRIKRISVAVIGDFALDRYFIFDTALNELSLETGLTAYQVTETQKFPGASGSVAKNLSVMGVGTVYAVGFGGLDGAGADLKEELDLLNINDKYMVRSKKLVTPQYIKTVKSENGVRTESNRFDIKNFKPVPPESEQELMNKLPEIFRNNDCIIVLDQMTEENCGVVTQRVRERLVSLAKENEDKIVLADSRCRIKLFDHMIVKCNHLEACRAFYPDVDSPSRETVLECGEKLYEKNRKPVFITLGSEGMLTFSADGIYSIPTIQVPPPIDIVGAGDSVTAAVASALTVGASVKDAGLLGNMTASVTIRQIGTTGAATPEQIIEAYDKHFKEII
jgi:rfaE bifunctional protein kinase chain/domain